jgi:homopolymeric O-antigen transport system ATP-binding protein
MRPIITVEHLSKRFRINPANRTAVQYDTLRESLVKAVRSPFRRARANGRVDDDTVWALKDVSFDVMPGEVMGVIGANGAGKSTLLSVLSRIMEPTSGRAELFGRVASLLEVGTGFHPDLSGRENIYLNGAVLGMKRREIEARFDEIVAFAEVERFIDTAVKRYSSGMYLRLAFAVAAHLNPEILLVDEVLAVGDASFQRKCLGKMDEVTRKGRTVLLVTHNVGVISQLCERAILLRDGQVAGYGPAQQVVGCYVSMSSPSAAGS